MAAPFFCPQLVLIVLRARGLLDRILPLVSGVRIWGMKERRVSAEHEQRRPDAELDLRGVICPYNFVKTKLKLESMEEGQILSVILDAGDPIRNVPQSVSNEGHTILLQEPVDRYYRIIIRRRAEE